ncbi:MAG: hypothetical protein H6Q15_1537 [Bacteroidetes bacterium]|nr:hypothetical protein [Bacteroidota bacterium]
MKKIILFLFTLICFISVNKAIAQPTLQMAGVNNSLYDRTTVSAVCTNLGGWPSSGFGYGFIYDTVTPPLKKTGAKLKQVSASAPVVNTIFNTTIDGLVSGKTYYVRAYAKRTSPADTVYSDILTVNIPLADDPIMVAYPASGIGLNSATITGEITDKKDAPAILTKGLVYDTLPNPKLKVGTHIFFTAAITSYPFTMTSNLTNLKEGQDYYFRSFCIIKFANRTKNDTIYSDTIMFKTFHACGNVPTNVVIDSIGITSAFVSWTKGEGQTKWEIDCDIAGHVPGGVGVRPTIMSTNDTITLTGLTGNVSYTVFIRAVCPDRYSDWSLVKIFTTLPPPCAPITNLSVVSYENSSAIVTWTPGSMIQNQWEVLFVKSNQNFPDNGTIIRNNPIFHPIGLTDTTQYKVKVRAICENDVNSEWSDEYRFRTKLSGLEDIDNEIPKVSIYPNPTDGTINFKTENNDVTKIEIWNSLGELIFYSDKLPKTYTLNNQSKGLFLIKIFTGEKVQIEKVILK